MRNIFFGGQRVDLRRSRIALFGEKFLEPRHGSILNNPRFRGQWRGEACLALPARDVGAGHARPRGARAIIVVNRGSAWLIKDNWLLISLRRGTTAPIRSVSHFATKCGLGQDAALKVSGAVSAQAWAGSRRCGGARGGWDSWSSDCGTAVAHKTAVRSTEALYPMTREFMDAFAVQNAAIFAAICFPAAS